MNSLSRKILIALCSLALVCLVYITIKRLSRSNHLDSELVPGKNKSPEYETQLIVDHNALPGDGNQVGMVGNVGFGTVEFAKFTNLNKDGALAREFGFKTLLHKTASHWEIEKPFMNIYQDRFSCNITADIGDVLLEEGTDSPVPKDVTLTGNVVVHITPKMPENLPESWVYLDDVTFFSGSSRFTTAGPVEYVSAKARMSGKALEIIYNAEEDRLELLRLAELYSLIVKTPLRQASFFAAKPQPQEKQNKFQKTEKIIPETSPNTPDTGLKPAQNHKVAANIRKSVTTDVPPKTPDVTSSTAQGIYYKCAFSENVLIESPGLRILADRFIINNILWEENPGKTTGTTLSNIASETTPAPAQPAKKPQPQTEKNIRPPDEKPVVKNMETNTGQNTEKGPEKIEQQLVDVVVTCDNGLLVVPIDSKKTIDDFNEQKRKKESSTPKTEQTIPDTDSKNAKKLHAEKIEHDLKTEHTSAEGFCELLFYTKDPVEQNLNVPDVPVTITSYEKAEYVPEENTITFEGNCLCKMFRNELDIEQRHRLSAPRIIVNLSEEKKTDSGDSTIGIEHLTATGTLVQLDSSRWKDKKLLGFTKLKCLRFDYDSKEKTCLAAGPDGIIAVDNSKAPKPKRNTPTFSLQRPCSAVLQGFDTLKYVIPKNRILANAANERIVVDYFPVIDGRFGPKATASAANIEVLFTQQKGHSLLSYLIAAGGVDYEDAEILFAGSELVYDNKASLIRIFGDLYQPCLLNGVMVPEIKYDLARQRITTKISAPGTFKIKR